MSPHVLDRAPKSDTCRKRGRGEQGSERRRPWEPCLVRTSWVPALSVHGCPSGACLAFSICKEPSREMRAFGKDLSHTLS